jgi:hypothetical protein
MPTQKDLKRLVRARMQKTGERYTTARAQLLRKRPPPRPVPAAPAPAEVDLAGLAGMSDASVAKGTGRSWKEWVELLDRAGAAKLPHAEIARLVHEEHGVPGWWSQSVTVGYERIRGLRQKGQRRDGSFEVSKSKVYPVPLEDLWKGFCRCKVWLDGAKLRMSKATKLKYMHMRWTDGTPVDAGFYSKGPGKSQVALAHRKIASREEAERLRAYWGERLVALGELLAEMRPTRRVRRASRA